MVTFSVIVPTIGRDSLGKTLDSIATNLHKRDQVLVVGDGHQPRAREIFYEKAVGYNWCYTESSYRTHNHGNAQRDMAISFAGCTHLLFIDDDDIYLPEALDVVRPLVSLAARRPHIFRAWWGAPGSDFIWQEQSLSAGNVCTPMVVVANDPRFVARWSDGEQDGHSDFRFIQKTVEKMKVFGEAVWREEAIAVIRPR